MSQRLRPVAIAAAILSLVLGSAAAGGTPAADAAAGPSTERSWSLPRDEPELPPGPGREAFYSACPTCHSTRYVTDQPLFGRDTWAAEIDKMKKTYGAEIRAEDTERILEYVLSVNAASHR
jgi:sulfite dehydrogenase (cytochrome) subunit B